MCYWGVGVNTSSPKNIFKKMILSKFIKMKVIHRTLKETEHG